MKHALTCQMIVGVCRDTGAEKVCDNAADVLAFGFPACNDCVARCRADEVIRDSDIGPLPALLGEEVTDG